MHAALSTVLFLLSACAVSLFFPGSAAAEPSGKLTIFHAGSLSAPFEAMAKAFQAKYPKVEIQREAGGSTKLAKSIAEGKSADIMASADYEVIDTLLVPAHAAWNALFATNQIVLCYTDKSKYAAEVNARTWTDILQRPDVAWGHTDPNLDPGGYRSLMAIQLAEKFMGQAGLYDKVLSNRPEKNIRAKGLELTAALQAGELDYAWEYLSVAVQHGLKYIAFDDHINLGRHALEDYYKTAVVKVMGKQPGEFVELRGGSITYGVTMLKNAPNPEAAEAFLAYLLDPQGGLQVLQEQGQPPIAPATVATAAMRQSMPKSLAGLVTVAK